MNIQVNADIRQKVSINPTDVIERLIELEIGMNNWVSEDNDKFYLVIEQSAGSHSYETKSEITEEKYRYVEALQLILKKLRYV